MFETTRFTSQLPQQMTKEFECVTILPGPRDSVTIFNTASPKNTDFPFQNGEAMEKKLCSPVLPCFGLLDKSGARNRHAGQIYPSLRNNFALLG